MGSLCRRCLRAGRRWRCPLSGRWVGVNRLSLTQTPVWPACPIPGRLRVRFRRLSDQIRKTLHLTRNAKKQRLEYRGAGKSQRNRGGPHSFLCSSGCSLFLCTFRCCFSGFVSRGCPQRATARGGCRGPSTPLRNARSRSFGRARGGLCASQVREGARSGSGPRARRAPSADHQTGRPRHTRNPLTNVNSPAGGTSGRNAVPRLAHSNCSISDA